MSTCCGAGAARVSGPTTRSVKPAIAARARIELGIVQGIGRMAIHSCVKLTCARMRKTSQIGGFRGRTARPICAKSNRVPGPDDRENIGVSTLLNKFGPSGHGEAQVQYLDGDFRVISPGTYVRCAVTDARIPLDELKYWSVDLQEAYAIPSAVLQRHFPGALKKQA